MRLILRVITTLAMISTAAQELGFKVGVPIMNPQGELSPTIDNQIGFYLGLEVKIKKIRTALFFNLGGTTYSSVKQTFPNYAIPDGPTTEVHLSIESLINYDYFGLAFEPLKGNPRFNPYATVGFGRLRFATNWDLYTEHRDYLEENMREKIHNSKTNMLCYGLGLRTTVFKRGDDFRIELITEAVHQIGGNVSFLHPEKNVEHAHFDISAIDVNNPYRAKANLLVFHLGLSVRWGLKWKEKEVE